MSIDSTQVKIVTIAQILQSALSVLATILQAIKDIKGGTPSSTQAHAIAPHAMTDIKDAEQKLATANTLLHSLLK